MDKGLIDIIACPKCKGDIIEEKIDEKTYLKCENCKVFYPVKSGIPVLLKEEGINEKELMKNDK